MLSIQEEFKDFLQREGMLKSFTKAYHSYSWLKRRQPLEGYLGNKDPYDYLVDAFSWGDSKEGFIVYERLHLKWVDYLKIRKLLTKEEV